MQHVPVENDDIMSQKVIFYLFLNVLHHFISHSDVIQMKGTIRVNHMTFKGFHLLRASNFLCNKVTVNFQ